MARGRVKAGTGGGKWTEMPPREAVDGVSPVRFVAALRSNCPAGFYCAMHQHPSVEIIYHARGGGRTRSAAGLDFTYEAGSVVVHVAREPHEQWAFDDGVDHCLLVAPRVGFPAPGFRSFVLPRLRDLRLRRELEDLAGWAAADDPLAQRVLDLRAAAVLAALWRDAAPKVADTPEPPGSAWVRRARRHMAENLATVGTIEDVAREIGVSVDHLRHLFTAQAGQSPRQYLLDLRVRRACDLLRHSVSTLDGIAAECGFANARQLCTTFRRRVGQTPAAWREAQRG